MDDKIVCHIDNARCHSIQLHIEQNNLGAEWNLERYKKEWPHAPLMSARFETALKMREAEKAAKRAPAVQKVMDHATGVAETMVARQENLHEVFKLGDAPAARGATGNAISIQVFGGHNELALNYLPAIDPNHVFDIDLLKKVIVGFEIGGRIAGRPIGMPIYLHGYHGTGKTSILRQIAARTGRPFARVQHTINTEESHIVGQYVVRDGETLFQPGPLPMAMTAGFTYCADEYDFAMPSVTAVYQAVLEGEPLIIKEAPAEYRVIRPHPNFRFVATGNTNGTGDDTGLYQGTLMGNAANFSRFAIVEEVKYMSAQVEEAVVTSQTGIDKKSAAALIKFATSVRELHAVGKISMPVGPRELINGALLGIAFGRDLKLGMMLAYANRLSRIDRAVVEGALQRQFG